MTECKFCDDKPERCVCSTPPKKKGWVEFDKERPETHPEAYRTCHVVSDTIEWESEEMGYWDGSQWLCKGMDYGLSMEVLELKWHYVTFPPKP